MGTYANLAFNNSVLLNSICDHLEDEELLCMMRTSRLGFDTAASRIWSDLDDIEPLLKLLAPTLELSKEGVEDVMKITLPQFGPGVFTRFNCYSGFVRKLRASNLWYINETDDAFCKFQLQPWSTLSLQAQRGPLLPNLEGLELFGEFTDENEIVLWISLLISPSLKSFELCSSRSILSHLGTATVLGLITQNAPKLEKLFHYLTVVPSEHDHTLLDKSVASQLVLSSLACGHLQNSQHLTCLGIGAQFVNSATLLELSRLPKLQFLSIEQLSADDKGLARIFKDVQLPAESFPSLQKLGLGFLILDDIVAAWGVKPLVSKLTAVFLSYKTKEPRVKTIYDDDVLNLILPIVSASNPHIKELTLDGVTVFLGSEPLSINLMNSPWANMGRLLLSDLKLRHFRADAPSFKNL